MGGMRVRWSVVMGVALLSLGGCTATRLATLQREFNEYHKLETMGSQQIQRWEQLQESTAQGYVEIASEALDSAGEAKKPTTRVAFYRLAAVAAWQAGEAGDKVYEAAQSQGAAECEKDWSDMYRPPRDCALLLLLPAIVANTELAPSIDAVSAAIERGGVTDATVQQAQELYDRFPGNTWQYLQYRRDEVVKLTGIDKSVVSYMDREERTYYCNFVKLEGAIAQIPGHEDLRRKALETKQDMFRKMDAAGRRPNCSGG